MPIPTALLLRNSKVRRLLFSTIAVALLLPLMSIPTAIAAALGFQENPRNDVTPWNEFRGPKGTGIALGNEFPTSIEPESIAWETKIHGKGWSSPVVWENQIWLTTATEDGKEMSVLCVDLTSGKILLDRVLHQNESPDFCHPTNSYASPTPVVEAGRVYVHFGAYGTTCLDTNSFEVLWQRLDLKCDHFRGPGSSPILHDGLLIVAFDGADQQYVVGLSTTDGTTAWKQNRDIEYGTENGDFKKSYGTGAIFDVDGEPLLVYPSAIATIAYRPKTGEPVWTVYHGGMNASARPLMTPQGDVLIANGMGKMICVSPKGKGNITDSNVRWQLAKGVSRKPSSILIEDRIFMIGDTGVASCNKTTQGESVWQERVGGSFSASPVSDGHSIFVCSEEGIVLAYAIDDQFKLKGKSQLGDGFKATPAIVGDRMILRSFSKLYCIEAKN